VQYDLKNRCSEKNEDCMKKDMNVAKSVTQRKEKVYRCDRGEN
jgi:hypothetical protein